MRPSLVITAWWADPPFDGGLLPFLTTAMSNEAGGLDQNAQPIGPVAERD